MLWEVDIYPAPGQPNLLARRVAADAVDLGLGGELRVDAARGYLIQGSLDREQVDRIAASLLVDTVVERAVIGAPGEAGLSQPPEGFERLVHVLPKPGVMDPVAQSALAAVSDLGIDADSIRTLNKYWFGRLADDQLRLLASKILANDAIEQVVVGPLRWDRLELGSTYAFRLVTVPLRELDDAALTKLSREGQLYLSLTEMQTIQAHFQKLGRDPTDAELETVAQTWSEHCSHKTLAGRVRYRDEQGERVYENMLKETIFAATMEIRRQLGEADWCVSVFQDNAGVVRFDEQYNVVFKVETHNHPSALEPYGGANMDRNQIAKNLNTLIADDAHIKLTVEMISIRNPSIQPIAQDFDKPTFIAFIDNIIYSMNDYSFEALLKSFNASADQRTAQLSFLGRGWGDGVTDSWYAGTVIHIRYGTLANCNGVTSFDGLTPRLSELDCTVEIRPMPIAGKGETLKTPEELRDMTH